MKRLIFALLAIFLITACSSEGGSSSKGKGKGSDPEAVVLKTVNETVLDDEYAKVHITTVEYTEYYAYPRIVVYMDIENKSDQELGFYSYYPKIDGENLSGVATFNEDLDPNTEKEGKLYFELLHDMSNEINESIEFDLKVHDMDWETITDEDVRIDF